MIRERDRIFFLENVHRRFVSTSTDSSKKQPSVVFTGSSIVRPVRVVHLQSPDGVVLNDKKYIRSTFQEAVCKFCEIILNINTDFFA